MSDIWHYNVQCWDLSVGCSIAEWWTQAQKARVQIAVATLSSNSLRQTVLTQGAKLVAALLRVARVTAAMAAYRRVYDSRHLQADCQEPGSAPEPCARQSSNGYLYLCITISALLLQRTVIFDYCVLLILTNSCAAYVCVFLHFWLCVLAVDFMSTF